MTNNDLEDNFIVTVSGNSAIGDFFQSLERSREVPGALEGVRKIARGSPKDRSREVPRALEGSPKDRSGDLPGELWVQY